MKKLIILLIVLLSFFAVARSVFAQTATLTATVRVNPLEIEIIAPSPSEVLVGKWFEIKAEVSNLGTEGISWAFATLNTSSEFNVRGSEKKNLGSLPSGRTKTVKWRVKIDSSGEYITTVEAKGNLAGEEISVSDTITISAIDSLGAFLLRLILGV